MSINAYRRAQEIAATPRSNEYRLMSQITGEMIAARDQNLKGGALMPVLHRNRITWNTFGNLCASPENQLPGDLRAGIISLALWVDRHTSQVMAGVEKIDDLISVNRAIIDGLSRENGASLTKGNHFSPEAVSPALTE
ncbi:flagellar biosynthesis regulator FlaF [Novosphingobium profundi]|uniref:flagellar biosynthesis regulator FlaF n=1 Tax=Novosphingobium profundi TaxID=1774954 RepID=UPI001BDA31BD|nr:flagellar biosynthesis regulator FlaF [Novosphingobium profundi]MBT0670559.1 flagellar biosynthesis regulator FlaF [Novosphingobium profundi]